MGEDGRLQIPTRVSVVQEGAASVGDLADNRLEIVDEGRF